MSPIFEAAPDDEIRAVGILLQRLADETDPALKLHAPALTQAVANLTAAVTAHKAAIDK